MPRSCPSSPSCSTFRLDPSSRGTQTLRPRSPRSRCTYPPTAPQPLQLPLLRAGRGLRLLGHKRPRCLVLQLVCRQDQGFPTPESRGQSQAAQRRRSQEGACPTLGRRHHRHSLRASPGQRAISFLSQRLRGRRIDLFSCFRKARYTIPCVEIG